MQRVKNPPIPLKEFASVESMREEINEVVAFLQNPRAFQEMGARAPRVCFSLEDMKCPYALGSLHKIDFYSNTHFVWNMFYHWLLFASIKMEFLSFKLQPR